MDPVTAIAVANGISALLEIWRIHSNKPVGWTPSAGEINDLLSWADTTSADYKRNAAAKLGIPWHE